jgi:hypothetical protein
VAITSALPRRLPGNINLSMAGNTIPQIKIDEALIGNTFFLGHLFEIAYDVLAQAHRNGLLSLPA